MRKERKLEGLRYSVGDEGWVKGNELNVFCPKHVHHKRKLVIDLETDKFHCWVCGWGGYSLEPIFRLKRESEFYREYSPPKNSETKEHQYEPVVLPKEFKPLSEAPRNPWEAGAIRYLAARGVSSEDIKIYKMGFCDDGQYRNRIIVPSFDENGTLNFFVGRDFYGNAELKYRHGAFCKNIIFNDYLVDWRKPVILVEGVFDAIASGPQAIPLLGSELQTDSLLFSKISQKKIPVYVALDNDAVAHSLEICEKFMRNDVLSYFVDTGRYKDPGDMPRGKLQEFMQTATPITDLINILKLQLIHRNMTGSFA